MTRGGEGRGPGASDRDSLGVPGREAGGGDQTGDLSRERFFASPEEDEDFFFLWELEDEEECLTPPSLRPTGRRRRALGTLLLPGASGRGRPGWPGSVSRRRPLRAGGSAPCLRRDPGRLTGKGGLDLHFHCWLLINDEPPL